MNVKRIKKNVPRKGVAAVEFAIVMPLLVAMSLGVIDIGQYANVAQKVSEASREGARVAARADTGTVAEVETAVENYCEQVFLDSSASDADKASLAAAVTVVVTNSAGTTLSTTAIAALTSGSQVNVNVTLSFDSVRWISALSVLTGKTIQVTTNMRRE